MTYLSIQKCILTVGVCITIAGFIGCNRNKNAPIKAQPSDAALHTTQDTQPETWTCPMHPQIKKDGPGKCPICGMDLVRMGSLNQNDQATPEGHASFHLSTANQQMIGVKFGVVEKKMLFKSIEAAGRVAFDPELYTAQNEYLEAIRQLERVKKAPIEEVKSSAKRMMESAKLRLQVLGLSDEQIAELGTTESMTVGSNLLIPSAGENVWVYAEVFEMDLAHVRPGLEVTVRGGALEGKELFGKVASVDRVITPTTRTAKVRVLIPNAKDQLRPQSYVDTTIRSPLGEQLVVPFDAILDSGKEAWVFVVKEDDQFYPRKVTVKYFAGDEVAISSGVEAGEKIVTSANFLIDSESRLKGVLNVQTLGHDHSTQNNDSPKTPTCPKGEVWHEQMKHCMPKVGN
ncbi:MAG: efflux RND transporter periplasmic adaptor subunit [Deltaproteobacteria bacterium]|nr:efflux RND transporter periplasmic adaptor subunit [Deltaproteobacteria bacterium]